MTYWDDIERNRERYIREAEEQRRARRFLCFLFLPALAMLAALFSAIVAYMIVMYYR